jgi:hypothetical protein
VNADLKTWVRAEWDRVAGVGLLALGAVVLIFGYIGVSNSTDTPEALCYVVSGGIGSILLFGAGAVLLISADLHDEWRKLNRIEAALDRLAGEPTVTLDLGERGTSGSGGGENLAGATPAPVRSLSGSRAGGDGRLAVADAGGATLARPIRVGATGIAIGAGVLGFAWWQTAQELTSRAAYGGVATGLGALLLASVAGAGALAWSRRSMERRKAGVLGALLGLPAGDGVEAHAAVVSTASSADDGWFVVAEGLTEYHRLSCVALPNHDVRRVRADAVPSQLRPCRLCEA